MKNSKILVLLDADVVIHLFKAIKKLEVGRGF